ncbi:MAG TPA: hydrogenase nickel incorporation protein HypB [bacterium]|nr:hydrogenase nickel incorporation protein HypB [bacterium]
MKEILVVEKILKANDAVAESNRLEFARRGILVINLMGTPGSGKTALLERTCVSLRDRTIGVSVIEGDIATTNDAQRLSDKGVQVVQINTDRFGNACHLDASMVCSACCSLNLEDREILFIENVGNLVCPAGFDLGESFRVVVLSVTEGEDKPLKYPVIFRSAHAVILNKTDLLPHLDVSVEQIKMNVLSVQPRCLVFPVSARTGDGFQRWVDWLVGSGKSLG